jgi:tRNA pseudouridine13 synthase
MEKINSESSISDLNSNNQQTEKVYTFNTTSEEDVGIIEYINQESVGFKAVLKHRYSDFLVNEIDPEGKVVWLKTLTQAQCKTSIQEEEQETGKPILTSEEDCDKLIQQNFIENKLIKNPHDIINFKNFLYKYINKELSNDERLLIDFIDDKLGRKLFHEKVRELFEFFDSETMSDAHGGSTFLNMQNRKNDRKGKNRGRERSPKKDKNILATDLPLNENLEISVPFVKKMVIFVNKNKTCFNKKRKMFADSSHKFLHFTMLKRNMDTVQAISYLARMLKRSYKTIKFAGNKDKRGITTQKISGFNVSPEELLELTKKHFWDKRIEIDNFEMKTEELRLGLLKGNQFSVVFRFIELNDKSRDLDLEIQNTLKSLSEKGFINYYGMQRFGVSTIPTHKVGLHVIKNQWREAIMCILHTQDVKDALRQLNKIKDVCLENGSVDQSKFSQIFDSMENINNILRIIPKFSFENRILSSIKKSGKNSYVTAFRTLNRQLQLLYPHAYQSYLWNMSVSKRIKIHGLKILPGDIVRKKNAQISEELLGLESGEDGDVIEEEDEKILNPEDKELNIRLDKNHELSTNLDSIFEQNYEYVTQENLNKYSFEDLYFPIFGSKIKLPKNETTDYIYDLLKKDNVKIEDFSNNSLNFHSTGYYRKVIEKPMDIHYNLIKHDLPDEDLQNEYYNINPHPIPISNENKYTSLRLQFQLPQSTYATMLFRELTKKSSAANYQAELSKLVKFIVK